MGQSLSWALAGWQASGHTTRPGRGEKEWKNLLHLKKSKQEKNPAPLSIRGGNEAKGANNAQANMRTMLARARPAIGGSGHCQEKTERLGGIQYLELDKEPKLDSTQNETGHSG